MTSIEIGSRSRQLSNGLRTIVGAPPWMCRCGDQLTTSSELTSKTPRNLPLHLLTSAASELRNSREISHQGPILLRTSVTCDPQACAALRLKVPGRLIRSGSVARPDGSPATTCVKQSGWRSTCEREHTAVGNHTDYGSRVTCPGLDGHARVRGAQTRWRRIPRLVNRPGHGPGLARTLEPPMDLLRRRCLLDGSGSAVAAAHWEREGT